MTLKDLLKNVPTVAVRGSLDIEILSLATDSKKAERGALFAAIAGTHADGHFFIPDAIERGALAIICEKVPDILDPAVTYIEVKESQTAFGFVADAFYGYPSQKLKLVGVTGTNGKTTIATLLYKLFESLGYKAGLISTVENRIHEKVRAATHTTPDTVSLYELLAKMAKEGVTHCFMEASSHAIEQNRIAGLAFAGGIFTNLTHDHLDYHKPFEAYRLAKKKFFDGLSETAFVLTNKDDESGLEMFADTKAKKYTYGAEPADFSASISHMTIEKMELVIGGEQKEFELVGRFNMYNLLAVYGTAVLLGEHKEKVLEHLSKLSGASGRFEKFHSTAGVTAIVDYAHTPDAVMNVLQTIQEVKKKNAHVITVVGCGGDRDPLKRPIMGSAAVGLSDQVFFTSDNPRSEDPNAIIREMTSALAPEDMQKVTIEPDRKRAIGRAIQSAQLDDIVLVAGKGHESYQEIQGVKVPFFDQAVVAEFLKN